MTDDSEKYSQVFADVRREFSRQLALTEDRILRRIDMLSEAVEVLLYKDEIANKEEDKGDNDAQLRLRLEEEMKDATEEEKREALTQELTREFRSVLTNWYERNTVLGTSMGVHSLSAYVKSKGFGVMLGGTIFEVEQTLEDAPHSLIVITDTESTAKVVIRCFPEFLGDEAELVEVAKQGVCFARSCKEKNEAAGRLAPTPFYPGNLFLKSGDPVLRHDRVSSTYYQFFDQEGTKSCWHVHHMPVLASGDHE